MAASKHAQQNTPAVEDSSSSLDQDNLVQMETGHSGSDEPNELNRKISGIDASIDGLRSELTQTNKGVKASLSHLTDNDIDLKSRVTETYRQLGELEDAYQSLSGKSAAIQGQIDEVSDTLLTLAEQSDENMSNLAEGIESLVERTDDLGKKAKNASQALNRAIKTNTDSMQALESKLTGEIESLAQLSEDRDEAQQEMLEQHSARLLKLQAFDQALEQRAESLEGSAADLKEKSLTLAKSTRQLDKRSNSLADKVAELQSRTEEHSGQIVELQEHTSTLGSALIDLADGERKRFMGVASVLALVILSLGGLYFYLHSSTNAEAVTNTVMQDDIGGITGKLQTVDAQLAAVSSQLQEMDDSVQSLDGRMNDMSPLRQFGGDNVIHGPQWIAKQPPENFMIHLATLTEKQAMYDAAVSYNHYLTEKLAYVSNADGQFALVYGSFETREAADKALWEMPRYIERQRPSVHQAKVIQEHLPKS